MKTTVVASMRNEGAFTVEWVCWYRMLGFSDVVVLTNGCTDHSPELLDALQRAGWLRHRRCEIPAGQGITQHKLKVARRLPEVALADWVLVCDVDEFLVIHRGEGRIGDLLGPGPPRFLGMAINWRVFGSAGIEAFRDLPVHRQFFSAQALDSPFARWIKTIHRKPMWFARLGEHGPVRLNLDLMRAETGQDWGGPGLIWVNAAGRRVEKWQPDGPYVRLLEMEDCDFSVAQINHYMLRSAESFSLKRGTPSPVAGKDRYTQSYWDRADRADAEDRSALRHAAEFDRLRAEAMALPGVARLHYLCCADHLALIAAKAGRRVADDPRHAAFLAQAASA